MVNTRGWRLVGAGVCALALTVAGCGDSSDPAEDEPESQGPLAEFFGWDEQEPDSGEPEYTEEERQQHYEVQEYIVTCMQEAGFEYTPQPFWADQEDLADYEDPYEEVWQLREDDPEAFAKQYGYGATTIDYDEEIIEETPGEIEDPNFEYRESLSPAAQEAYDLALYGDWEAYEEEAEEGEDVEYDPEEIGGCDNLAWAEIAGNPEEEGEQFEELWETWDKLYQRIEDDPRLADVKQAWSSCMAEAGYPDLEDVWDAENEVYDRQGELFGWNDETPQPDGEDGGDGEDTVEPTPVESFEPVEPDPDELAELKEFELAIAWADYQCKQEHDYERIEREVRFEHEEQFIEENRAELEAYRDWQNEQPGFRGGAGG